MQKGTHAVRINGDTPDHQENTPTRRCKSDHTTCAETYKTNLATSIPIGGDFTDEEFKASIAKNSYVQWRKSKSLPELAKMQAEHVYCVLQGLIAMYHEGIPMYWFRADRINVPKAELLYVAYCHGALPLTKLGQWANVPSKYAMKFLAWAIRRKHQVGESIFSSMRSATSMS